MTTPKQTIRDRNLMAFLMTNGFKLNFIPRSDHGLDAEVAWSKELDTACQDYRGNRDVPVQTFISSCRFISDRIRDQRKRGVL